MKRYICHSCDCVWFKIAPDPDGNPMDEPTCHHPTTEDFEMVFPLMDTPDDARVCRRFKQEKDYKVIMAKIDAAADAAVARMRLDNPSPEEEAE